MDDEMTLREALNLLVGVYVRDSDTEDWSVGQGPEIPPSAIPSLIEAWAVVIRAIRGLGGEEFQVELRETMSEGSEEARLQDAAIAKHGVDVGQLHRLVKQIEATSVCPTCGQARR